MNERNGRAYCNFFVLWFVVEYLVFSLLFGGRQQIVTANYSIFEFFNLQTKGISKYKGYIFWTPNQTSKTSSY